MNTRDYKNFAPGSYFHLYNRGNGKQDIFLDKQDYTFFMNRLIEALFPLLASLNSIDGHHQGAGHSPYKRKMLPEGVFELICFCLMPNHFHLLIKQITELPISMLISKVCTSYSKYFNKKYDRVGHVFQDQFRSILVENNSYALWLSAYIHQNPKVAGLVNDPVDYFWSSYREYMGVEKYNICKKDIILDSFIKPSTYSKFVDSSFDLIKQRKDMECLLLD